MRIKKKELGNSFKEHKIRGRHEQEQEGEYWIIPAANYESSEVIAILLPVTFHFNPWTRLDNVKNLWRFVISSPATILNLVRSLVAYYLPIIEVKLISLNHRQEVYPNCWRFNTRHRDNEILVKKNLTSFIQPNRIKRDDSVEFG